MVEFMPLIVAAVLAVLILFLRTNVAVCFLALCAGSVLVEFSGTNVGLIASSVTSGADWAPYVAKIVLLLTPLVVCIFMLRGQTPKSHLLLNLIPAIATALLAVLFIVPLLPEAQYESITSTESWTVLSQYEEFIVGVGVVMSIVSLMFLSKRAHSGHKKGRHK